jgi:hypothetical protein
MTLWSRFEVDHALCEEFLKCNDPKRSNKFWHSYIKSDKSFKFVSAHTRENNMPWLGHIESGSFAERLQEVLGLAAHPSLFASTVETAFDWTQAYNGMFRRSINPASHFTLSNALFISSLPFSLNPKKTFRFTAEDMFSRGGPFGIPHKEETDWQSYSAKIWITVPIMFLGAISFINGLRPDQGEPAEADP